MTTTVGTTYQPPTSSQGTTPHLGTTDSGIVTATTVTTTADFSTTDGIRTNFPDVESSTIFPERRTPPPRKRIDISENEVREILKDYLRRNLYSHIENETSKKRVRVGPQPTITPRTNGTSQIRLLIQAYRLFHMSGTFFKEFTPEEQEMLVKQNHLSSELKAKVQRIRELSQETIEKECERIELEKLRQLSVTIHSPRRVIYKDNKTSLFRYNSQRSEVILTEAMRIAYKEYEKPPFDTNLRYKPPNRKDLPYLNKKNELWLIPVEQEGSPPRCTLSMCQSLVKLPPTKCCPTPLATPRPSIKPHKSRKEWEVIIERKQKAKAAAIAANAAAIAANATTSDAFDKPVSDEEDQSYDAPISTELPTSTIPPPSLPPGVTIPLRTTTALTITTPKPTILNPYLHPKRKFTIHPRFRTRSPIQLTRRTGQEATNLKEKFVIGRGLGPLEAFSKKHPKIQKQVQREVRTTITTKTVPGLVDAESGTGVTESTTVSALEPNVVSNDLSSTPPPELEDASDEE